MKYTSAFSRLSELPEVFTGRDLALKYTWGQQMVSTYLSNWRKAGLIRSLGGHSDVHLNLVATKHPNVDVAVMRVWPLALRVGADVLREAGWTTQIPSAPELVIPADSRLFRVDGFTVTSRSATWFDKVRNAREQAPNAIPRLLPIWALADMIDRAMDRRLKSTWLLAPDDLDLSEAAQARDAGKALSAFGLSSTVLTCSGYEQLYDDFFSGQSARSRVTREEVE